LNIKHNVSEIRRLIAARKESTGILIRFLISKGINPSLAKELVSQGKELTQIKDKIKQHLHVTGELVLDTPLKLVFIGPTGVGKTTTVMKLASYYSKLKKKIAFISLDIGKKSGLEKWAEMRRIPFFTHPPENEFDLLLIDTEGCNFYQPNRVEELGEKLSNLHLFAKDSEILLTLSAAAKEVDLYGAVHQFSTLSPKSLVFTKLDETLAAGVLVNVCAKTDLPIRYIAFGYPLPGDVQIADSESIIHKILTDFNAEEFQILRQLSLLN